MLNFKLAPSLDKKLSKIKKKNKKEFENIKNKIMEIASSDELTIENYKNLKKPMQHLKRAHVNSHFVLTFNYDKNSKLITFIDYRHHNEAYK